jgi:hypothetical protein
MRRGVAVLALAVLLAGCGDDGGDDGGAPPATDESGEEPQTDEAAVAAFERSVEYVTDGQYGRAYANIHPAQQELFDQATYEQCVREFWAGIEVTDIEVQEVFEEEITIPGTDETTTTTAITAEITLARGGLEQSDTDTFHEVYVDGQWTFTVSSAEAFAEGRCS